MNVGTGSIPLDDISIGISKRDGAGTKPAILGIDPSDTILGFVGFSGLNASHPVSQASFLVIGVKIFEPAEAHGRTGRGTGVLIESAADVIPCPVGLAAENNIGRCLDDGIEFLILARQI